MIFRRQKFIELGKYVVNIDQIIKFWFDENKGVITVCLTNGDVIDVSHPSRAKLIKRYNDLVDTFT